MEMTGEHRIALPQEAVWRALNDPEILKASVPGCEELVRDGDSKFRGRIAASVGPVRAKFSGEAVLSEIDPPNGYVLTGSGSGGAAGMAKGSASVRLTPDGDVTVLRYEVKAQVAGKLAQIGSRLVDMAAKKMADEFFTAFAAQLAPVLPPPAPPAAPIEPVAEPVASSPAVAPVVEPAAPPAAEISSHGRSPWLIWVGIALIVLIAALWLLSR